MFNLGIIILIFRLNYTMWTNIKRRLLFFTHFHILYLENRTNLYVYFLPQWLEEKICFIVKLEALITQIIITLNDKEGFSSLIYEAKASSDFHRFSVIGF